MINKNDKYQNNTNNLSTTLDLEKLEPQSHHNEADSRSVFVSNIDFNITPAEIEEHFKDCGEIVRITLFNDNKHLHKNHKQGYSYIEFENVDCVEKALQLNDSILEGNKIKIQRKRTNIRSYNKKKLTLTSNSKQLDL
ncbi:hypothetical protein MOUN0_C02036 [Monosporozyma unispora]|nr:cytoplasmic RNA-binding protein [Kazachstania unispora]